MSAAHLAHDWFPEPIPDNVRLGPRSWLYSSYAFARSRSRLPLSVEVGNDSGIYIGTVFDLGPRGQVRIGNFCTLVATIICCNCQVVIHDFAFLAHEVVLADHFAARPYDEDLLNTNGARDADLGEPETGIVVGENSWVGAAAILLRGAKIGEGSIVGAGAVVDFDVPPYSIVAGNPARIVRRCQ